MFGVETEARQVCQEQASAGVQQVRGKLLRISADSVTGVIELFLETPADGVRGGQWGPGLHPQELVSPLLTNQLIGC